MVVQLMNGVILLVVISILLKDIEDKQQEYYSM